MAYSIDPEAFNLAMQNIRGASNLVEDPVRRKLEQLQAREAVASQGQSAIQGAMRQGSKVGAVSKSGASQATSGALGRVMDASREASQGVAIQQAKDALSNRLSVANAAQGLGATTAGLNMDEKKFNEMVRQYNEQPERMRQQMELQLELKRRGLPYDKDLLKFEADLQNRITGKDILGGALKIGSSAMLL